VTEQSTPAADWSYTDPDGSTISLSGLVDPSAGPGVLITTGPAGAVIPSSGLQAFVSALVNVITAAAAKEAGR
jgi:hypothetical protein